MSLMGLNVDGYRVLHMLFSELNSICTSIETSCEIQAVHERRAPSCFIFSSHSDLHKKSIFYEYKDEKMSFFKIQVTR